MFRVRSDGRACFYCPTILGVGVLFFARLCYTIRMAEKIALVTGASSGFGLLTSIKLQKAGFRVVATMRNLGRELARWLIFAYWMLRSLTPSRICRRRGPGLWTTGRRGKQCGFAEDIKLEELRLQFETNLSGVVAMTKAELPTMRQQRSGHIIQVSSISGLHGAVAVSSYAAEKHALEGWSESLAFGIFWINSRMRKLRCRLGDVCFLTSSPMTATRVQMSV